MSKVKEESKEKTVRRIKTYYTAQGCQDYEILSEDRVTDGSQYHTIDECIQMVARGEAIELHDYTQDNPFDRMDQMDVADHAEEIIQRGKQVEEKLKKQDTPDTTPESSPESSPEPQQ